MEQLLTSIPNLRHLDVSSTSVSGELPPNEVSKIEVLRAWGSFVAGTIPAEIASWSNLRKFAFSACSYLSVLANFYPLQAN